MRREVGTIALIVSLGGVMPRDARAQDDSSQTPPDGAQLATGAAPATAAPDAKPAAKKQPSSKRTTAGAKALMPGFETLPDGSTRVFVELSQAVAFDTKASGLALTYVLKGTAVERRNNTNPLVTIDFNTAVASARLVPHGKDVWLNIVLRAKAAPTVSMDTSEDGGAVLRVAFAKGDYLPALAKTDEPSTPSPEDDSSAPSSNPDAPPPPKHHHHHSGE